MFENIILSLGFYMATVVFTGYSIQFHFIMALFKNTIYKSCMKILYLHLKYQLSLSQQHMHVLGCNTWIVTGISETLRKIRFNITVSAFSLWEVYKFLLFWKGFFFFFKGCLKSIMLILLIQHAQIISNQCELETTKKHKEERHLWFWNSKSGLFYGL